MHYLPRFAVDKDILFFVIAKALNMKADPVVDACQNNQPINLLCIGPQVVALIISVLGHFSLWNLIISIEISTGSEINEDFHVGVGISLRTPVGGLNPLSIPKIHLHDGLSSMNHEGK